MMKYTIAIICLLSLAYLTKAQTDDTYAELSDSRSCNDPMAWDRVATSPQISWGSIDVRYAKRDVPVMTSYNDLWKARAWRGERINAQAVIWTKSMMTEAVVTVGDLTCSSGIIPSAAVRPSFVRYVMTDELNKDGKGACGHRPDKSAWDSSLVADVLHKPEIGRIEPYSVQPVWINVAVPSNTRPGVYKGVATISGKDFDDMKLRLEITVRDRLLPPPGEWSFHLDLWQNPYSVARYYNVPLWSDAHFALMRPLMKQLAEAGQKVITATIMHKPWNGQTEDHFDSMVSKVKHIDGRWEYDYTVFDRWIEFMMSVGIDRQINCYTLIPWALTFDYFDKATNRVLFVETKPGEAAYSDYWGAFLKDFASHLREKGWFDRTTIAMDERGVEAMIEAVKVIREADPAFRISLAGNYHGEIEGDLYDYCIAYGQQFPEDIKASRDASGKVSTVYTCCSEARPNTFTFSPPSEAAWIGWHTASGGYGGYLRWAYNSWTSDPMRDSRFRTWAAGDCYIAYPGYSSIRMERLVEGIQDYEKIRILREEFTDGNKTAKLRKLTAILSHFKAEDVWTRDITADLNAARATLNGF